MERDAGFTCKRKSVNMWPGACGSQLFTSQPHWLEHRYFDFWGQLLFRSYRKLVWGGEAFSLSEWEMQGQRHLPTLYAGVTRGPPGPNAAAGSINDVVTFLCSWCGPRPASWAAPVRCAPEKDDSGKCLSALISLGNHTFTPPPAKTSQSHMFTYTQCILSFLLLYLPQG